MPPEVGLAAVGLTWRDAPTRVRARAAEPFSDAEWAGLRAQGARGLVELHTCARSLWVVAGDSPAWLGALVQSRAAARAGLPSLPPVRVGTDAASLVLRVAVGLDSFVQGESDVGRQLRRAFDQARATRRDDGTLNLLAQSVAHLVAAGRDGGWIRRNRGVGRLAVDALVRAGVPRTAAVGVVGAGDIGRRVVASLKRAGWAEPVVYNRTPMPHVKPLDDLAHAEQRAWVVCTAAPRAWFAAPEGALVVDLGTPAQVVGPAVGLDALLVGDPLALPADRVRSAEAAVEREVGAFLVRLAAGERRRGLDGTRRVRDRFLAEQLGPLLGEALAPLAPDQRRRVLRATEHAIRRYNHQVVRWLRDELDVEGA